MVSAPVVHVDESGNSGENLLDPAQPVFVLAAVHLADTDAERLAAVLAGDAVEGHHTRLRKRPSGQARVLEVLGDDALTKSTVRVSALHKPYMAVAKLVDLLYEPVVAAAGYDLYANGWARKLTDLLQDTAPQTSPTHWAPMLEAFVQFVWRGTPETATELVRCLVGVINEGGDHPPPNCWRACRSIPGCCSRGTGVVPTIHRPTLSTPRSPPPLSRSSGGGSDWGRSR